MTAPALPTCLSGVPSSVVRSRSFEVWVHSCTRSSQGGVERGRSLAFRAAVCCDVADGWCCAMAQARVFGRFAAHSMAGRVDDLAVGFNFELFTHTARFFDFKVLQASSNMEPTRFVQSLMPEFFAANRVAGCAAGAVQRTGAGGRGFL